MNDLKEKEDAILNLRMEKDELIKQVSSKDTSKETEIINTTLAEIDKEKDKLKA